MGREAIQLKSLKYFKYKLNFKIPFTTSVARFESREGFIIKAETDEGVAFGEAAPLPGFSKETFDETEKKLISLAKKLPSDFEELFSFALPSSLSFAFEQAFNSIIIAQKGLDAPFGIAPQGFVKTNALISLGDKKDFTKALSTALEKGYERIKIKIGVHNFEEEFNLLELASKLAKEKKAKLRLDVNGKWKLEEAKKNLQRLEELGIEYVEQPVKETKDLVALAEISKVPLAADESILDKRNLPLLIESKVNHFVLKPMLLGGLRKAIEIQKQNSNKRSIISSTFESPVGISYLIYGASLQADSVHGIPPVEFNSSPLGNFPFKTEGGKIIFDSNNFPLKINFEELE